MSWEILYVFAILGIAIILFISDKVRLDLVAIGVMLALSFGGILTPAEAVAGFGAPVVLLIAGLFIVGEGLAQTGISYAVGDRIVQIAGQREAPLIILLMLSVASLAAFMSVTGAGAIFIPVAIRLAIRAGIAPSRLLMPLAFGALIGGMLTLIGTPPNLIANAELQKAGLTPFGFFSFTPIGLIILAIAIIYFVLYGRHLLPSQANSAQPKQSQRRRSLTNMIEAYEIENNIVRFKVLSGSPLIGHTVVSAELRRKIGLTLFGIERHIPNRSKPEILSAHQDTPFQSGDRLYGVLTSHLQARHYEEFGLDPIELDEKGHHISARELGVADIIITPQSQMIGRTLTQSNFRKKHDISVVAIMRKGHPLRINFAHTKLEFGDQLLLVGDWDRIRKLRAAREDFLVLSFPEEIGNYLPRRKLAPIALAILAVMLGLIIFKLVPSVLAVLTAAAAMVVTSCVSPAKVYSTINWRSLVLIAGMMPMATALEKSGGLSLIVDQILALNSGNSPLAMLVALFLLTSILSQFTSNTATAILIAPVALKIATILSINPEPLLMSVAIAASTAFSTPVASPINTLVMGPGGYRFRDFARIGIPLQFIALLVSMLTIPYFLPF